MLADRRIGEKGFEQHFVIALERDVGCRKRIGQQAPITGTS